MDLSAFVIATGLLLGDASSDALRAGLEAFPDAEAGGSIYECGDSRTIVYTKPISDGAKRHVSIPVYDFHGGCQLVAVYHTHPKGDSRFSRDDIEMACRLKVPSYLQAHGGEVRVFDCSKVRESMRDSAWQHPVLSRGERA